MRALGNKEGRSRDDNRGSASRTPNIGTQTTMGPPWSASLSVRHADWSVLTPCKLKCKY